MTCDLMYLGCDGIVWDVWVVRFLRGGEKI